MRSVPWRLATGAARLWFAWHRRSAGVNACAPRMSAFGPGADATHNCGPRDGFASRLRPAGQGVGSQGISHTQDFYPRSRWIKMCKSTNTADATCSLQQCMETEQVLEAPPRREDR